MQIQTGQDFPISDYLMRKANKMGVPLHGTFELTSRCNFNCKMCYVHDANVQEKWKEKEMSAETWLKIAEQARNQGLLVLLLTGGEAMVRKDFAKLYEKLAAMGFRITINTNGSLITEQILACFEKYPPSRVNVSLYGASEDTYENLCQMRAMKKVEENIRKLLERNIRVRILMTITSYNEQDMREVYRISQKYRVPIEMTAYMFPKTRLGKECGNNGGRMSAQMAGECLVKKERLCEGEEVFLKKADYFVNRPKEISKAKEGEPVRCQAGRSAFWITWDGKMRPCGMMTEPEVDVVKEGFFSAWERIRMETAKIRLPLDCAVCEDKELCKACAAMCQTETGSFDKRPDYVCQMTKAMKREFQKALGKSEIKDEEEWEV